MFLSRDSMLVRSPATGIRGGAPAPRPCRGPCGGAIAPTFPQWDLDQPDQKGWLDAEKDFKSEVQHHGEAEERRLAYVAYTRAKFVLWASSAAWNGSRSGMAGMSAFLSELAPLAGVAGEDNDAGRTQSVGGSRPVGGGAVVHAESVAEEALPEESPPLTAALEVAHFPYDPWKDRQTHGPAPG